MPANSPYKIGIVAPDPYVRDLGLYSLRRTFAQTFPQAQTRDLQEKDLLDLDYLKTFDLIILPSSQGEITPYEYFLKGKAADNIGRYVEDGGVLAAFCSGAYALMDQFFFTFSNGIKKDYRGYIQVPGLTGYGPVDRGTGLRLVDVFEQATLTDEPLPLCYDGGPGFVLNGDTPDLYPLAYFKKDLAAIVAKQIGQGVTVAFGVLAEIQAAPPPQPEAVRDVLLQGERRQNALWMRCMDVVIQRRLPTLIIH